MIVGDHLVAEESRYPCQAVPQNGRTDVPHMHGLGHIGRTEIDHHPFGACHRLGKSLSGYSGLKKSSGNSFRLEPNIDETRSSQFRVMSHFGNIEMAQHFFRSLSGIEFEPLGNRHDRRALVIAKGSIGANLKTDETQIHVGKNRLDGLLKTGFNPFGQYHGRNILSLAHREVAEGSRALSGGRSGLLLEERFHGISITGLLQGLSEIIVMEYFCNVGQRVEMFLKLPLRDQEEHHQVDRFVV